LPPRWRRRGFQIQSAAEIGRLDTDAAADPVEAADVTIGRHDPVKGVAGESVISARVFNRERKNGEPQIKLFRIQLGVHWLCKVPKNAPRKKEKRCVMCIDVV
jgi:hypothetical protein